MAFRIFQLCVVFAIGIATGPGSFVTRALNSTFSELDGPSLTLQDPHDVIVEKGQSATLKCRASSTHPGLQISWFHNDTPIPQGDARREVLPNGTLHIPKVVPGKRGNGVTGEYSCLARNMYGALLSGAAKLRVATIDREITRPSDDVTVNELQPALLQCNIHSTPPADIEWEYNSLPLPQDTRYVPLPNGALLITKTESSDAGSYRCIAKNPILEKVRYSSDLKLTVKPPLSVSTPLTLLPLNITPNYTVLMGGNINLHCAVIGGWPIALVQWIKNDTILISNTTNLLISNASPTDSGNYSCLAHNPEGQTVRQDYRVEVQQKPFFNVTPTSGIYPSAKLVRLNCQAKGIPIPKTYWLKDGKPLAIKSRIKKQWTGLVFSHTFTTDSGIYQCVASNSVGKIWTAARIEIKVSQNVSPPQDVKCRPYDETSICLNWRTPPNVLMVQAYSINAFYTSDGVEVAGPDYVTQRTHKLIDGLKDGTNYTFYVRLYSKDASDRSDKVTCTTGVKRKRNLDIDPVSDTSVMLRWSEQSTDVLCDGRKDFYEIQWRRKGQLLPNSAKSLEQHFVVTGLTPATDYEFLVFSVSYTKERETTPWIPFTLPEIEDSTYGNIVENDTVGARENIPSVPKHLDGVATSSNSVKLNWDSASSNTKYYTVCYVPDKDKKDCETDGEILKSFSRKLQVSKLKSNTVYEFRVKAHNSDGVAGSSSRPVKIRTPADVPSPVLDLKYKIINSTTACLRWRSPKFKNGKLQNYVVSYTPDRNWPLEKWLEFSVQVHQRKSTACWSEISDDGVVSTYLTDLSTEHQYMVMVRAVNEVGIGKPTMPLDVMTNINVGTEKPDSQDILNNQKIGVIVGVIMALVCVICCILCILLRRRCLKRRALARARMAASNNYHPAVAHYASHVGSVQVRLEDPCSADVHEIEHLVTEESPHIPPITTMHLDTKGIDDFPNGLINGSSKPYINGNATNGHIHIRENPQFYAFDCNGHAGNHKKIKPQFKEDSNSNVRPSKFYDLYRLFENSKKSNGTKCSPHFERSSSDNNIRNGSLSSSQEASLNVTHLTCLDDSLDVATVNGYRRVSPILGPNG